jgi:hypothetical protein
LSAYDAPPDVAEPTIPLGPAAADLADEQAPPPVAIAPDSGMIKGAAGMVNLDALAELTTLDEIELLATQPMSSILAPGVGQPAAPTQMGGDAAEGRAQNGAEDATPAPHEGGAAHETLGDVRAAPVTAEVMAAPPAHGALLRGLPYDTTPLPQMTTPLPIAGFDAFLRGAPSDPPADATAPTEAPQADEERD